MSDYDEYGYPTDEALDSVRTFEGTPEGFVARVAELANGGFVKLEDDIDRWDRPFKKVSIVTGGWSGVESLVGVIEETLFNFAFWESSHRGGLFTYEVTDKMWQAPGKWGKP